VNKVTNLEVGRVSCIIWRDRAKEGGRQRIQTGCGPEGGMRCSIAGFGDGGGPRTEDHGQPPEAARGKQIDSPLEPQEGARSH